ncbi:MAG: hypothetical protein JO334_18985 [Verrucomicrobia bacterium]|nr:hypothetical protein [Verrucomicrobiota bacterium]
MKKRAEKKITVLPNPKRIMEKDSSVMPLLFTLLILCPQKRRIPNLKLDLDTLWRADAEY